MKKIFTKKNILIFCLLLLICVSIGGNIAMAEVVGGGVPPVAKSATSPALPNDWGITGLAIRTLLIGLSSIAYVIFVVCSWFLGICGTMLNVGIQITTNLGAFINNTPVIYKIWEIVRDFSSMILIFFILYAAILKIIGMEKANYGNMIKNIIIMGILINFSFFFTQVAIDASNVVSLQFANALMPDQEAIDYTAKPDLGSIIYKTAKNGSGGFSGIIVSSLKVNQWWSNKSAVTITTGMPQLIMINLALLTGALVEVLAGLSMLAAAAATIFRTIILIFLLGFSAIWIAAMAVPQLKEFKDKWMGQFKAQLLFLPVYLGLMYIAVRFITESGMNTLMNNVATTSSGSSVAVATSQLLQLSVGFAFILVIINIPIVVAVEIAGQGSKWIKGMSEGMTKWASTKSMKGYGAAAAGFAGRSTLGRAANRLADSEAIRSLTAKSPTLGRIASGGLNKVSSAEFLGKKGGYDAALKAKKTAQEKTYERLGDVDATKYDTKEALDTAKKAARNRQEMYLGNLPFKSSTLSFLLDDKAHRQTANKMAKDVLANQIDDNEKAQKEIDQKMKALAKNELAEALLSDSEKKEYAELKKQYNELQEKITEGKKAKGGKEWKKFLENVGKEVKENEGGGKPKEEPKTKPDDSGAKTT